jgi:hypothetical protein
MHWKRNRRTVTAMARSGLVNKRRPGLPGKRSVVMETVMAPTRSPAPGATRVATSKRSYRIIRTNEVDPKDSPMPRAAVAPFGAPAVPIVDAFTGTARKAAKLALATAAPKSFSDLQDLLKTLPSKTFMKNHTPKITTDATSGRVAEEKRNVHLRAFLYAASREADNDFHLIVGRDASSSPHVYMTIEISGLPPPASKSFVALKAARDAYKKFFGSNLPGTSYDFYDPPIPIAVEGSLFFDMTHASGQGPGPASLRKNIPTIWEIHPVSSIVFEP